MDTLFSNKINRGSLMLGDHGIRSAVPINPVPSLSHLRQAWHWVNRHSRSDAGDHIYACRKGGIYAHHGIYIGEERVIHYQTTRESRKKKKAADQCRTCKVDRNNLHGVVKACVTCFLNGHSLRRFSYGVDCFRYVTNRNGTCTTGLVDSPEIAIRRTNECLLDKGFGDYSLFENNCETFAMFCKTNKKESIQAFSGKLLLKECVKLKMDSLLHDVKVHYGQERHDKLKLRIDGLLSNFTSVKLLIATLSTIAQDSSGSALMITDAPVSL